MPSFSGRFEYLASGRGAVQSGRCELSFDEETVTIVPAGPPMAFDLGDIDVFQPGDYEIRLSLWTGHALRLTHFAKAFQDLERQLRDAYRDRLVKCLLVSDLDEVARFTGQVDVASADRRCSGPAEIRLYESNLAVLPDAAVGFQWRLADIDGVEFDERNYAVVFVQGGERLTVGRLAKRTGELADRVRSRITALNQRTTRTLRALFPFLSPEQFPQVAALMREGKSAPIARLRSIHHLIDSVLIDKVVDAALKPYVKTLVARSTAEGWYAGFKVIRQGATDADAEGLPADQAGGGGEEEEVEPDAWSRSLAPAVLDAGAGLEVLYWFFFPIAARGGAPTHLAWEATSRGGRATYVFRLDPGQSLDAAVAEINRGLVSLNFRREPVYLDDRKLESELRYRHYAIAQRKVPELSRVRRAFVGRAIHTSTDSWTKQFDALLSR